MSILTDIGGTFVRFAALSASGLRHIKKYKAEDFEGLQEALAQYCTAHELEPSGALRIATAGYEDNGVWKFVNQNKWVIDPGALKTAGWNVEVILNDFEASVWVLTDLKPDDMQVLKSTDNSDRVGTVCLLGPGTGLGLGYLHQLGGLPFVQKTHGGHMPVSALTDEQWMVVQAVQRLKEDDTVPVFENFVSGPGLYNIYQALCLISGKASRANSPENMLDLAGDREADGALRLFHEFFGLFAATAVITGHAYGGLYLTGGVLQQLMERKLFDLEHFEKFFCLEAAASVKRDLMATPIIYLNMSSPALHGLMVVGPDA